MTAATRTAPTRTAAVRGLPLAGAVYVTAWLLGLVIAPAAPTSDDAALHAHHLTHTGPLVAQSLLVHGVAGLALAVVAVSLGRGFGRRPDWLRTAGLTAATLSLLQVVLLLALVSQLDAATLTRTAELAGWIDRLDGVKLLALAVFTGFGVTVHGPSRALRVLRPLSAVVASLLVLGAIAVGLDLALLTPALYLSLPLLLIWVGLASATGRHPTATDRAAAPTPAGA